jgi:hypothetical protein
MHIEPGVVHGAKMALAYATAAGAGAYAVKLALDEARAYGALPLAMRSAAATAAVFVFFELLPHFPVGVSEVHFILGTTILLILGAAPAAIGLAAGLAIQGLLLAPSDLPMYAVNVTTLLVPLFGIRALAERIVPAGTPYVDLRYREVLALSATYQGGVVAWVAFWALYGSGTGAETLAAVASFGAAYLLVILVEPVVDLAALAGAKGLRGLARTGLVHPRLHHPA